MSTENPLFPLTIYFIAFITAYFISKKNRHDKYESRYETIDGLRGFLALGVFIHHAAIWQQFLNSGKWNLVESNVNNQLGGIGVSLFFMITSFLFITKLLNSKPKEFNWFSFYKGRVLRLFPMYYFSLTIIILLVLIKTNWHLNESWYSFLTQIKHWIWFSLVTIPDINNFKDTFLINAGVTWSLPYEWFFYFSLPIIAFFLFKKPKITSILIALVFIFIFFRRRGGYVETDYFFISFIGGAIAPFLIKFTNINSKYYLYLRGKIGSLIIISCFIVIIQFEYAMNIYCMALTSIIFTLIAIGNSFFGVLKKSYIKLLGDISYSTYLLHGIILYITFNFIFTRELLKQFSETNYSILIFTITPFVVIISFITYTLIEKPFMRLNKKV